MQVQQNVLRAVTTTQMMGVILISQTWAGKLMSAELYMFAAADVIFKI
jgi:hypothetical protein